MTALRLVKRVSSRIVNSALARCERIWLARVVLEPIQGPIFIIGPPRSGTTLLYEAIIHRFRVTYLTNVHNQFYGAPALVTQLLATRLAKYRQPSYDSSYGTLKGRYAPGECGNFWYRWFPGGPNAYVPRGALLRDCVKEMQRSVSGIQSVSGMPVVFKTTYNTVRIGALVDAFPNACFLVCKRDPVDVAQSILRGRVDLYGDKGCWLGVAPREYEKIKTQSAPEQIADQVFFLENQIATDEERFGASRFFYARYEEICKTPRIVALNIEEFLRKRGISVQRRDDLPESFPFSTGCKIDRDEYDAIVSRVRARYGDIKGQKRTEKHP